MDKDTRNRIQHARVRIEIRGPAIFARQTTLWGASARPGEKPAAEAALRQEKPWTPRRRSNDLTSKA
jgi:hypothetical protein